MLQGGIKQGSNQGTRGRPCAGSLARSVFPVFMLVTASSPEHHQVLWRVCIISASQVNNVIFHCLLLKMHSKRLKPEKCRK